MSSSSSDQPRRRITQSPSRPGRSSKGHVVQWPFMVETVGCRTPSSIRSELVRQASPGPRPLSTSATGRRVSPYPRLTCRPFVPVKCRSSSRDQLGQHVSRTGTRSARSRVAIHATRLGGDRRQPAPRLSDMAVACGLVARRNRAKIDGRRRELSQQRHEPVSPCGRTISSRTFVPRK